MKLKLNLKDKILKPRRWIGKIKENKEVFIKPHKTPDSCLVM